MLLGFDTETYLITSRDKAPKPVCCTWHDGTNSWITTPEEAAPWLSSPDNIFCGINIAYDMLVMMRWHPTLIPAIVRSYDEGRVYDCSVRECLIYLDSIGARGYNPFPTMKYMAKKYLGIDLEETKRGEDSWRLKYGLLDGVPFNKWPKEALDYALDDARYSYNIFKEQGGIDNAMPTEGLQTRGSLVLSAIGAWGFNIDNHVNNELTARQEKIIAELHKEIDPFGWTGKGSQNRLQEDVKRAFISKQAKIINDKAVSAGVVIEWDRYKQYARDDQPDMKHTLSELKTAGIIPDFIIGFNPGFNISTWVEELINIIPEIPRTGKKQRIETSEAVLKTLYGFNGKFKSLVDLKHEEKMLSTYCKPFDVNVSHGRYTTLVSTGRTACTPPHQTIPRAGGYRKQFAPRKGSLFGTSDYKGLELCTLAAAFRHEYPNYPCRLGQMLDDNIDVHSNTASLFLGETYEQVVRNKKDKGKYQNARQGSKASNFGFPGGLWINAFIAYADNTYGVKLSYDEAKAFRESWKNSMPEIDAMYLDAHKKMCPRRGDRAKAVLINGRAKAGCTFTELSNFKFQGLAADGAKAALYSIWREIVLSWYYRHYHGIGGYGKEYEESPLYASRLAAFVHDEIVAEHQQTGEEEEAFKRQQDLMVYSMEAECQHLVRIQVESELSHEWSH